MEPQVIAKLLSNKSWLVTGIFFLGYFFVFCFSAQCGSYTYDPTALDCCNNFLLCDRGMRACCGKFCHTLSTTVCCGDGTVIDKCSVHNSSCCSKKCYDRRWHMCCNGKLMSREQCFWYDGECCGDQCYNRRESLCCNGKIVPTCGWPSGCCGQQCYSNYTQDCCEGTIVPKCPSGKCCGTACCPV